MLFGKRSKRVLRLLADHHQLAFERVLIGAILAARHKALADYGHRGEHGLAKAIGIDRHIAPADHALAFLGDELFKRRGHKFARGGILRQEAHGDRIVARLRQLEAFAVRPFAEQLVGQLDQQARAITQQRVGTHRTAVVEVFENFQRLAHDGVRFLAFDMGNQAHATGVMFVARIVEALAGG